MQNSPYICLINATEQRYKKQKNMKKGTTVITHDSYVGVINGVTKQGYIVKFTNGKERHFLPNQLRDYDASKVNTYIKKTVRELEIETVEKLIDEASQYTTEYANGMKAAYAIVLNMLKQK